MLTLECKALMWSHFKQMLDPFLNHNFTHVAYLILGKVEFIFQNWLLKVCWLRNSPGEQTFYAYVYKAHVLFDLRPHYSKC